MAGLGLQGGFGAGGAVDALRVLTAEAFRKQQEIDRVNAEQAQLAENARQFNETQPIKFRTLQIGERNAATGEGELGLRNRELTDKEEAAKHAAATSAANDAAFEQAIAGLDPVAQAAARANRSSGHNVINLGDLQQKATAPPRPIEINNMLQGGKAGTGLVDPATHQVVSFYETRQPEPKTDELRPYQEIIATQKLQKDWDAATADYRIMKQQAANMQAGIDAAKKGDLAAGSQAVLVTFQKILDPNSVVRESEYARSAAGQSVLSRLEGFAQRLAQGGAGVPVEQLEKFKTMADDFIKAADSGLSGRRARLERQAQHFKLDPALIFDSDVGSVTKPFTTSPQAAEQAVQFRFNPKTGKIEPVGK